MNYKLFPMIHDDYYSLLFSTILVVIINNYPIIVVHY